MEKERIDSMLARITEIRREVSDWEADVRPLPGGRTGLRISADLPHVEESR